jgi:hypothetical protein
MDDRYTRTIASAFLVILVGSGVVLGLNNKCKIMAQNDCLLIWGLAALAIVGGTVLTDAFVTYRIDRYEQQITTSSKTGTDTETKQQLPGRYVWLRSVIRLSIASLLLGLPVIIQSAFAASVSGLFIGFGLNFFIRGILNRLPPKY